MRILKIAQALEPDRADDMCHGPRSLFVSIKKQTCKFASSDSDPRHRAIMAPSLVSSLRLIPGTEEFLGLGFRYFRDVMQNLVNFLACFSLIIKDSRL